MSWSLLSPSKSSKMKKIWSIPTLKWYRVKVCREAAGASRTNTATAQKFSFKGKPWFRRSGWANYTTTPSTYKPAWVAPISATLGTMNYYYTKAISYEGKLFGVSGRAVIYLPIAPGIKEQRKKKVCDGPISSELLRNCPAQILQIQSRPVQKRRCIKDFAKKGLSEKQVFREKIYPFLKTVYFWWFLWSRLVWHA